MLHVESIDHVVFNVSDVEVSAEWYQRVLGMERRDSRPSPDAATRTSLVFGRNKINLRPTSASKEEWFTAQVPTTGSEDLCFLTTTAPDQVAEHFRSCGVEIITGPVTKSGARGPIRSVYVRDPDGNLIEVSSYE